MGWSMNSPMSAKATMASMRERISSRDICTMLPWRYTFSRPVKSGLKPLPSSSSAPSLPFTRMAPEVGLTVPAIICSSVVFPDPLRPTMPSVVPWFTRNESRWMALNLRWNFRRPPHSSSLSQSWGLL